jgi:hypothetical protein
MMSCDNATARRTESHVFAGCLLDFDGTIIDSTERESLGSICDNADH